jgi:hypothetical protein
MPPEGDVKLNGWNEWSRYVLAELKRLNESLSEINRVLIDLQVRLRQVEALTATSGKDVVDLKKAVEDIQIKAATLNTAFNIKSGVWGLIGAAIPTVGIILFELLKKKIIIP